MNYRDALETADKFDAIGGFTRIEVEHFGFLSQRTPESEMDGRWNVNLWAVNPRVGNRNLTVIRDIPATPAEANRVARAAKGKATARDKAALARIAAERAMDKE